MNRWIATANALMLLLATLPASADGASGLALRDCSQKFLANWLWNRQAALAMLPKQPCILYGEHGQYVCDQNGCTAKSPR